MRRTLAALSLLLACGALLTEAAYGQSACTAPSPDCVVVGQWDISVSLGVGERSNPIIGNSDIPLVLIPQISYYGERFFLENLDIGYTLYEGDVHTINLLGTPGYDRVFFVRDDLQNYFVTLAGGFTEAPGTLTAELAAEPRRTTYLTGLEWLFTHGPLIGQVDALYEATGRHKGYEVRAALAAPLMQSADSLVVSAGMTWKSAELVEYYYGMQGLYEPGSALNPFLRIGYMRPLSDRWSFSAFVHYERLGEAIADSPIVADSAVTTLFAGVVFKIL